LYRISTPADAPRPFVAGLVTDKDGIVKHAAPILYKMFNGRSIATVIASCAGKGWKVEYLG
jgi:hypothetical protein